MMKVTKELLIEKGACCECEGYREFERVFPDGTDYDTLIHVLEEADKAEWKEWVKEHLQEAKLKHKVGDWVRVREDLETGKRYGGCPFVSEMAKHKGQFAQIMLCVVEENVLAKYYRINLDNFRYWRWTDEMFCDHLFKAGEKVWLPTKAQIATVTGYADDGVVRGTLDNDSRASALLVQESSLEPVIEAPAPPAEPVNWEDKYNALRQSLAELIKK